MSIEHYLFAKICLNIMLVYVHAFFACRACTRCLDYTRNNVWNAVILEAVPENGQFLNLQVQVSQEWNRVTINCDAMLYDQVSCVN